ncbi:BrnT family toxin [Accumulibacter sp.]|uniref:BrnT family toxin n=1 Tax=Accumulibacter sp. TaxID=2053492 RepID=UPI00343DB7B6
MRSTSGGPRNGCARLLFPGRYDASVTTLIHHRSAGSFQADSSSGGISHTVPLVAEWDEATSDLCFRERGLDFAYAAQVFFDPDRMVQADTRYSHGEKRHRVIGAIEQRFL